MMAPRASRARLLRARIASTLIELLTALAIFGVIAAAIMHALDRQARFHDGVTRILESRSQLAAAHDALAVELRAAASVAGDVASVSDTSVVYRTQVGGGVACAIAAPTLDLPPEVVASGQTLTHFATSPQPGDTAWLFDEGAVPGASDDRWIPALVAGMARLAGACVGTPFVDPVLDLGKTGWRLTLGGAGTLPPGVVAGTVARLTRRARFALYRASTGEAYLGWTEWNSSTGGWNVIQPVSGPFLPFNGATPGASGVAIVAVDSGGARISPGLTAPSVAHLAVTARAITRGAVRIDGLPRGRRVDSLGSVIALRNRG